MSSWPLADSSFANRLSDVGFWLFLLEPSVSNRGLFHWVCGQQWECLPLWWLQLAAGSAPRTDVGKYATRRMPVTAQKTACPGETAVPTTKWSAKVHAFRLPREMKHRACMPQDTLNCLDRISYMEGLEMGKNCIYLILFYLVVSRVWVFCRHEYRCRHHVCAVPVDVGRGRQISWNWSDEWL